MALGKTPSYSLPKIFVIIFSDLDGTLLDSATYRWDDALPALTLLCDLAVPLVLASSKTCAEIELLRRQLSLPDPFIAENGGAVFFPPTSFDDPPSGAIPQNGLWKWTLGLPYSRLVRALHEIRKQLGWEIRGFSEMSVQEISTLTGLDKQAAGFAAKREHAEPFLIQSPAEPDKDILQRVAGQRGMQVISGGRFYHLQGKHDKAQAMQSLIDWYGKAHKNITTAALGDGPNDFAMLMRSEHPFLVKSGRSYPELEEMIPHLQITPEIGPKGWNRAVLDFLAKHL